ncbi:hypothetical protein [Rhodococcus rhodochrous]|uniref:hypothetical protein n=1 Tax=Rhodococcus rhodochrous TaxID=1829 RepID=UPI0027DF18EE|nr:hypothetical protein [Rhodococcus rhodochrous]
MDHADDGHDPARTPPLAAHHRRPCPPRVAIAHLDTTALELLPLRAGDQLIVNAARTAVRAHATSPTALARFLDAGCGCCPPRTCTPA